MALSAAVRGTAEELRHLHDENIRHAAHATRMHKLSKLLQKAQEQPGGGACEKPKRKRRAKAHTKPADGVTAAEREDLALERVGTLHDLSLPELLQEYCATACTAARLDIRVLAAARHIKQAPDVLMFQADVSRAAAGLALDPREEVNLFAAFTKAAKDRARAL